MKRNNPFPLVLSVAAALLAAIACGPKKESTKMLVLYYSQNGGTEAVATEIASRLGADIEKIVAIDLPREGGPDVPPAHSIQVYVLVEEGQAPVFTQVIR